MQSCERQPAASGIAQRIMEVMPLLKRRLTHLGDIPQANGMPLSHIQVLSMLSETGAMTVSEISARFGIAKPNITPLVDRLIELKLVARARESSDRRVVRVVILDAGRQKLREIQSALDENVRDWASGIPSEDLTDLSQALETVARVLSAQG